MLEIYKGTTIAGGSNVEYEAKIAALEQQIEALKEQLNCEPENKTLYTVCTSIHSNKANAVSASGTNVVTKDNRALLDDVWACCTFKSEKLTFSGYAISLPAGEYNFSTWVPNRLTKYDTNVGYKIFKESGELIVDHTSAATEDIYASTDFELKEQTNIYVKWYRTNPGWTDMTYYEIKAK